MKSDPASLGTVAEVGTEPVIDGGGASPTVIVSRRPASGREAEFERWVAEIRRAAAAFPGHLGSDLQPPSDAHPDEWVTVYRFRDQADLDRWLGSAERAELMEQGEALTSGPTREQRMARPGAEADVVTAVMSQRIRPADLAPFQEAEARIAAAMAEFPGFLSFEHAPPVAGVQDDYVITFTFSSRNDLDRWLESDARREVLTLVEPFIDGERTLSVVGGFGGWFVAQKEDAPPRWKQAIAVLIALYPTTFVLSMVQRQFFADVPWMLALFASNVLGIAALTWLLMPRLTSVLEPWLKR